MGCLPSCLFHGFLGRVSRPALGLAASIGLVCLMPSPAAAETGARPLGTLASPDPGAPPAGQAAARGRAPMGAKRKRRKHGKAGAAPARKMAGQPGGSMAAVHRRDRRHRGAAVAQPAKVALVQSPGPAQTPEALRAMDKVRHMQIERAEDAARRPELTNRWQTVNFLISGVDEQRYPAAGFWKALSCYRLGRIDEGDSTRQRCQLSAADVHALDGERSVALLLTSENGGTPAAGVTLAAATSGLPASAVNNAAYTGPGPAQTSSSPVAR